MMEAQGIPFDQMSSRHDELLREVSTEYNVAPELLRKLVDFEKTKVHLERRRGAKKAIRDMIEDHLDQQEQ